MVLELALHHDLDANYEHIHSEGATRTENGAEFGLTLTFRISPIATGGHTRLRIAHGGAWSNEAAQQLDQRG